MDNDTLYDSLDEEFASSSSLAAELQSGNSNELNNKSKQKINLVPANELINKNYSKRSDSKIKQKCIVMSSREVQENLDISSIVPLYSGDKYKSELRPSKKSSSSPLITNKRAEHYTSTKDDSFSNNINVCRRRLKFTHNSGIDSIMQGTTTKSYLSMFHSRMGYSQTLKKKELNDTARSLFGGSQRSVISDSPSGKEEFLDAEENHSDTTSFYFNQIEEEKSSALQQAKYHIQLGSKTKSKNLKSVTDVFLTSTSHKTSNKRKPLIKKPQTVPIPILGGLGPDRTAIQEKMERRKKQLLYGQKASNRNRIKMVELSVLKNLKNEMHNSSLIDKKQ